MKNRKPRNGKYISAISMTEAKMSDQSRGEAKTVLESLWGL
jgi:hypothetical protein